MALWGNSTSDESRPKWLRENDGPGNDLNNCFADERGWVLRHPNGYEEVLVTISGLSTKLANATIANVYFRDAGYDQGDTGVVVVNYNEKVTVTSGATLTVTGSSSGIITATAATQTCVQQAEFTFGVPSSTETLSIAAQTISGTIVDCGTSTASDKVFVSGDVKGVRGRGTTKTISVA